MKQLSHPPKDSRLLWEPDPTFVQNVKDKMIADPAAPGATAMAVMWQGCRGAYRAQYQVQRHVQVRGPGWKPYPCS